MKQTIECELDIPYGSREAEKFDIFGAQILPSGCYKKTMSHCQDLLGLLA